MNSWVFHILSYVWPYVPSMSQYISTIHIPYDSHINYCLVVSTYPSEKYGFVSWGYDITNKRTYHEKYPLVICYIAIENGPVKIVDVPVKNGGSFHSYGTVYQRVTWLGVPKILQRTLAPCGLDLIPCCDKVVSRMMCDECCFSPVSSNMASWEISELNGVLISLI